MFKALICLSLVALAGAFSATKPPTKHIQTIDLVSVRMWFISMVMKHKNGIWAAACVLHCAVMVQLMFCATNQPTILEFIGLPSRLSQLTMRGTLFSGISPNYGPVFVLIKIPDYYYYYQPTNQPPNQPTRKRPLPPLLAHVPAPEEDSETTLLWTTQL